MGHVDHSYISGSRRDSSHNSVAIALDRSRQIPWAWSRPAVICRPYSSEERHLSLFALREGFRVVTTTTGGRIGRDGGGPTLDLTPIEVQLLARSSNQGLDPRDPALAQLIPKLNAFGVLTPVQEVTSDFDVVAPEDSGPAEDRAVVPLFRRDLKFEPSPTQPAVFQVTHPETGKTFSLYDFEVSLARMLDGERRYFEAVDAGQRLGIPVSLESLTRFIKELEGYGFLLPSDALSDPSQAQPEHHRDWDPSMRALFQSGVRLTRQGRYAEAASYFEAMLSQDPQTPEAVEMLTRVKQRLGTATDPRARAMVEGPARKAPVPAAIANAPTLLTIPVTHPSQEQPMSDPDGHDNEEPNPDHDPSSFATGEHPAPQLDEEASTETEGHHDEDQEPTGVEEESADGPLEEEELTARRPRWGLRLLVGVVILAGIGVAVLFFSPVGARGLKRDFITEKHHTATTAATEKLTETSTEKTVETTTAATSAADTKPGTKVETEAKTETQAAETKPADTKPGEPTVVATTPEVKTEAKTETKAEVKPETAPATDTQVAWTSGAVARKTRAVQAKLKSPGAGFIQWTAKRNDLVARGDIVAKLLKKPAGPKVKDVKAAKAGLFVPALADGKKVRLGQLVATISSAVVTVQGKVKGPKPRPTWRCEVVHADDHSLCKIRSVAPKGKLFLVTVTTDAPWIDKAKGAQLHVAP